MNTVKLICILLLSFSCFSQDAWQPLSDFPTETRIKTSFAVSDGAVVLTSIDGSAVINVYVFDVSSDSWEQKADFPYLLGNGFTSFTLNDEGYVMCDDEPNFSVFIWKYNALADTWEPKTGTSYSDFGFGGFYGATFAINNLGYLLVSGHSSEHFKAYDPISDSWTVKASYPSYNDGYQSGFSIGDKGYFAYNNDNFSYYNEFWEYDPTSDSWTRKADVPMDFFSPDASFSIGDYGYVGMYPMYQGQFYRYSPTQDTWESIENCGYGGTNNFSFSIGDFGYVGSGVFQDPSTGNTVISREVWKLDPDLLSVSENELDTVFVTPNPAKEIISVSGINENVGYEIYSLNGVLISKGQTMNKTINTSYLSVGVYILKFTSEKSSNYLKLVKN